MESVPVLSICFIYKTVFSEIWYWGGLCWRWQ